MNILDRVKKLLSKECNDNLRKYVLDYIVDEDFESDDEVIDFFTDLFRSGCVSGMIGGLITYTKTHAFYDKYYYDIEELRQEWMLSVGEPLKIEYDLKNTLAWFGFERTVRTIADELELEV